jgi:hypothetical protein
MRVSEPHSTSAPAGYLLLDTVPTVLAMPAVSVLGIVRAAQWNADLPAWLSGLISVDFAAAQPEWVLRLGSAARPIAVLVSGAIRFENFQPGALLLMPALSDCASGVFSRVVVADGRPSALVVNIDALLRAHPELGNDHGIQES